jgi:hypothetical protein
MKHIEEDQHITEDQITQHKRELREFLIERGAFGKFSKNLKNKKGRRFGAHVRRILDGQHKPTSFISGAYTWGETEEGDQYWRDLHNEWEELNNHYE